MNLPDRYVGDSLTVAWDLYDDAGALDVTGASFVAWASSGDGAAVEGAAEAGAVVDGRQRVVAHWDAGALGAARWSAQLTVSLPDGDVQTEAVSVRFLPAARPAA